MLTQDMALLPYRISIATLHRMLGDNSIIRSVCSLVKKKGTPWNGWKTGRIFALQRNWKKVVKKCWQGGGGVVLYLSAKRWGKRMTSEASAGSPWKEPIDAEKLCGCESNESPQWGVQANGAVLRKQDGGVSPRQAHGWHWDVWSAPSSESSKASKK